MVTTRVELATYLMLDPLRIESIYLTLALLAPHSKPTELSDLLCDVRKKKKIIYNL